MGEATVRDLRNHGGRVLDRVAAGERVTITRDGTPVARLEPAARGRLSAEVQETEASFDPLPLDAPAARAFGRVAAHLRQSGRQVRPRAFDALIAAIAMANDLPLCTSNPRDFGDIPGLTVVAVPHPDGDG